MKSYESVKAYIADFPKDVQVQLKKLQKIIKSVAPQAEECISYGMPAYKQNGVLVYFGAYEHHIGFYPTASGVKAFAKKIAKYKHTKGTIHFSLHEALPAGLITKIVKFKVKENQAKVKK